MTTARIEPIHPRRWKLPAIAVLLSTPIGLGLSVFGFGGWIIGPVATVMGAIGCRERATGARWVMWIGVGLTIGLMIYLGLALATVGEPSSGGGSS